MWGPPSTAICGATVPVFVRVFAGSSISSVSLLAPSLVVPLFVAVAAVVGAADVLVAFSAGFVDFFLVFGLYLDLDLDLDFAFDCGCSLDLTSVSLSLSLFATRTATVVSLSRALSGTSVDATLHCVAVSSLSIDGSSRQSAAAECSSAGDGIFWRLPYPSRQSRNLAEATNDIAKLMTVEG